METEIIIHNSISLDSSLTGFMPDMSLHYKIAGDYKPDAHLIGSETIIKGIEMFGEEVPEELPGDFNPSNRHSSMPWWVIVDSGGKLKGFLHTCRRLEYCRDIIILVSERTPGDYITYLKERNYKFIVTGKEKVDLRMALEQLREEFNVARILTDTGRVLLNILLNMGMVNEISLLVHPLIIGENGYSIFSNVNRNLNLKLKKSEQFENGCVWMVYSVEP
ncbi:MAG: dihydrofolate reductase family protein [Bacteroidales bacterium]|nr:dihydrofolate reductase family protein [Bacteroidales bacterium]